MLCAPVVKLIDTAVLLPLWVDDQKVPFIPGRLYR